VTAERRAGFTLLELLIAITLLGLLMAGLLGGLRLGARAWDRSADRLDESGRLLAVHGFLTDRLSNAMPIYVQGAESGDALAFAGEADRLTLVTTLPDQLGPGLHTITLGLAGDEPGRDLVMAWQPFRLDENGLEMAIAGGGRRVLLNDVAGLTLGYFGAPDPGAEPTWHEVWQGEELLPTLIRLELDLGEDSPRRFPDLIVRPMVDYLGLF
jgi:general secretion pathway protein J